VNGVKQYIISLDPFGGRNIASNSCKTSTHREVPDNNPMELGLNKH